MTGNIDAGGPATRAAIPERATYADPLQGRQANHIMDVTKTDARLGRMLDAMQPGNPARSGHTGIDVGSLLNHEERTAPIMADKLRDTRRSVLAMERGEVKAAKIVQANIIDLFAAGHLPKAGRRVAALLGFRSENGAVRFIKVAQAALAGVTATVTPLRRPTDPPKSIPEAVTYRSWPDAVAAQGVTACYNAARAALKDADDVPTRREAFGKAVVSRLAALHRLMALGASEPIAALLDGRLMSQKDVEAFYVGPDGLMERGATWDDVMAEMLGDDMADEADGDGA